MGQVTDEDVCRSSGSHPPVTCGACPLKQEKGRGGGGGGDGGLMPLLGHPHLH